MCVCVCVCVCIEHIHLFVYADVSCKQFQEVNKYCLKPAHGLYEHNDCLKMEGIYPLTG